MKVYTTAVVNYICYLDEEDSKTVRQYAEEHDCDYADAVDALYVADKIDLYYDSVETDFNTDSIDGVSED